MAVLPVPKPHEVKIHPNDIEESFVRGSGPGGQHRNKTSTAVQLRHVPTNILIRVENGKSQKQNRETALELLRARLFKQKQDEANLNRRKQRQQQVGTGMRGDKVRTIQVKHNRVTNHNNNKTTSYKDYKRGLLKKLWN